MVCRILVRLLFCSLVAGITALTTHIYIQKWTQPFLETMTQHAAESGINLNPDPSTYSLSIIYAAYITAIIMIGFLVFCYYHTQHLISGQSKITKTLMVIALLFGVKGSDLIRQPIMCLIMSYTIGLDKPLLFVFLNHIDKWLANILLAVCLVCLCPKKIN